MAAKLPPKYTGAVVLGSNISGTFATVISILSGSIWSSVRKAAIYFFITAIFVILLCFDTYFAMPLNKFYRYHEMMSEKQQEKAARSGINVKARPPYFLIFKQSFMQLFNVFFTFFVTLTVFPAVHSDIKQIGEGEFMGIVPRDLFVPITCFLTFNVFAMLGSLTTSWVKWVSQCEAVIDAATIIWQIFVHSLRPGTSSGQLFSVSSSSHCSCSATTTRWPWSEFCPCTSTTIISTGASPWLWAIAQVIWAR